MDACTLKLGLSDLENQKIQNGQFNLNFILTVSNGLACIKFTQCLGHAYTKNVMYLKFKCNFTPNVLSDDSLIHIRVVVTALIVALSRFVSK